MTDTAGLAGGEPLAGRRGLTVSFRAARSKFFLAVFLLLSGSLATAPGPI